MNKETNISQAAILAHALDLLCDKIMDADTGPDYLFEGNSATDTALSRRGGIAMQTGQNRTFYPVE